METDLLNQKIMEIDLELNQVRERYEKRIMLLEQKKHKFLEKKNKYITDVIYQCQLDKIPIEKLEGYLRNITINTEDAI